MITEEVKCDICGKVISRQQTLPFKFSTDNIAHQAFVKLNENPSISIASMSYMQYCSNCMRDLIRTIAKEQKWNRE